VTQSGLPLLSVPDVPAPLILTHLMPGPARAFPRHGMFRERLPALRALPAERAAIGGHSTVTVPLGCRD